MVPPVDVIEDSTGITLYADLPGLSKDKLNMQIEADTLTIEGELSLDTPANLQASRVKSRFMLNNLGLPLSNSGNLPQGGQR